MSIVKSRLPKGTHRRVNTQCLSAITLALGLTEISIGGIQAHNAEELINDSTDPVCRITQLMEKLNMLTINLSEDKRLCGLSTDKKTLNLTKPLMTKLVSELEYLATNMRD